MLKIKSRLFRLESGNGRGVVEEEEADPERVCTNRESYVPLDINHGRGKLRELERD